MKSRPFVAIVVFALLALTPASLAIAQDMEVRGMNCDDSSGGFGSDAMGEMEANMHVVRVAEPTWCRRDSAVGEMGAKMHVGPHMTMTDLQPTTPDDLQARA